MNQSTTDNSPLQLYPPKIQGQTEPVKGAHVGVPLVAYDLVSDGEGAKVQIDPPLVGIWESEDVVKLWLVNDTTLLSFTTIGDPNVPIFLRIPRNRLHPDEVNQLYYTVERNSNNTGTSEPPLQVLYNRIRPGLKDRFPEIDGHSELELDLSDLIKQGVGKDFVSAPVCFSYPYCRAYDTISLKCNGEIETFPVSKDQAPEPPNPGTEVPTTVCFTVEREFLDKAKRQNKVLNFSYTVTDQLLNGPDPDAVWSAAVAVNEDLDGTLLDTPILREIAGDTADEPGIIDLKKLGSNPLLVYISTVDPRFEPGDKIEATYTAKIAGQDDKTVVLTGQVETDDIGNKITCVLKVLNKDVIVATSVSVKYKLLRKLDDTLKAESNIATATVVGDYMELKPASVQQANGNTLAPMAAVSKLTIVVPQGTTLPTDLLSVSWIPEPGTHAEGTYISDPRPISEVGLNVDAPPALVAFCLGGRVTVSYTITRGNGQPQPSDPFILNVQELPQAELIAPRLKEASNAGEGSELNLAELTPEGKMWCSGFPFNAVGQYVWLLFKGTNADDSTYEKYIWAAPFAFVNDDWVKNGYFEATAPYEDLKGLKDGTPMSMEMWVAFGKSEDLGLAKRFLLRTYTVSAVQVVVPAITSVKGTSSDEEIPPGSLTVQTDITLTGTATPSTKIDLVNGSETISDDEIPVDVHGDWTARLRVLVAGNTYNLRAKRKDGELSAAHDLVVVALVKPTLDTVLDDQGVEVPEGQTTVSTKLKLKGTASKGQWVEAFEGSGADAESKGTAPADETTGEWEREIEVKEGPRQVYVKSRYHKPPEDSNVRTLTVLPAPAGENFDAQPSFTLTPGSSRDIGSMTITNFAGTKTVEIRRIATSYPGKLEQQTLALVDGPATVRLMLKSSYAQIEFWYTDVEKSNNARVVFYNSEIKLKEEPLLPHDSINPHKMTFNSDKINKIDIISSASDTIYFDNFVFKK